MEELDMKDFIIKTMAVGFIVIVYYWLTWEMIIKYDNYISVLAFPILIPIMAWVYDRDL